MMNQSVIMKKILLVLWVAYIIGLLGYWMYNPNFLDHKQMKLTLEKYVGQIMLIYFLICLTRGIFLLPSSPFIVLGALLFPNNLWLVFFISIIGVFASATVLYYFSTYLGFDTYFTKKFPDRVEEIQRKMNSPKAFILIVAWSAFPFVPTDLMSYVAGTIRMNFFKMIAAMIIGELPLMYLYVFYTQKALQWFII
jgi:uncharacterized membrane protein YdjX (TVP38/TMEM64 family)